MKVEFENVVAFIAGVVMIFTLFTWALMYRVGEDKRVNQARCAGEHYSKDQILDLTKYCADRSMELDMWSISCPDGIHTIKASCKAPKGPKSTGDGLVEGAAVGAAAYLGGELIKRF